MLTHGGSVWTANEIAMFKHGLSLVLMAASAAGADRWIDYRIGPFHVISDAGDKAAREKLNQIEQLRYSLGIRAGQGRDGQGWSGDHVADRHGAVC